MIVSLFTLSAVISWVLFLLSLLRGKLKISAAAFGSGECIAYIGFTIGLALYIHRFNSDLESMFIQNLSAKKPLSWLLFSWCIYSSHILVQTLYRSEKTQTFANLWLAASLTLLPNSFADKINQMFSSDLSWLNLHRISFLLGYSFCMLAAPIAVRILFEKDSMALDRLLYRLILWALPLLSLGIVVEALLLVQSGSFPTPEEIWSQQKEMFLALGTWLFCGLFLHLRLFLGWKSLRSSALYLFSFAVIIAGHLSKHFLHFS